MALPREPRQKMINIMYLVLTAILALNVSAEILEAFKTVDRSLINSNINIEAGNKGLFTSLAAKLADPKTNQALAQKWATNANIAVSTKYIMLIIFCRGSLGKAIIFNL